MGRLWLFVDIPCAAGASDDKVGVTQGIHGVTGSTFDHERWAGRRGTLAFVLQGNPSDVSSTSFVFRMMYAQSHQPIFFLLESSK
jgi:hypothetical protein